MMSENIIELGEYFKALNVNNGIIFLIVNFPEKWEIDDNHAISDKYGIEISKQQEGLYFLTELKNGCEVLFEAAKFIVNRNKELEAKRVLLLEKVNELTQLFSEEPLERLHQLRFVMDEPDKFPLLSTAIKTTKRKTEARNNEKTTRAKNKEVNTNKVSEQVPQTQENNNPQNEIKDTQFAESIKEMIGEV